MKKILILTALILALPAQAELYKAKFGLSNLTIHGNSSVHKWKVETKVIGGFLNIDSAALSKTGTTQASGTVIVPVRQVQERQEAHGRSDARGHERAAAQAHQVYHHRS